MTEERIVKITRGKLPAGRRSAGRPKKDGVTTFRRIRRRQGCEEKQATCLYTVGRRRRIMESRNCHIFSKITVKNKFFLKISWIII